ncbi:MAG TPA: hypothetical protein VGM56_27765 [Byssovorax sp.]|jgi:hypothetical protein
MSFHRMLTGLVLVSAAAVGCSSGSSSSESTPAETGSSEAKIVVANDASAAADVEITATNTATGDVSAQQSVHVAADADGSLDLALDAGTYAIHVEAHAASDGALIAAGDATAQLIADSATQIRIVASATGSASSAAGTSGSGSISTSVGVAPEIDGVTATVNADGSLTLDVDATDPSGESLSFYYAGFGLDGAVQASDSLTITAAEVTTALATLASGATASIQVVAQDTDGASTAAAVTLDVAAIIEGSGSAGSVDASASASLEACVDASLSCEAACDASLALDPLQLSAHASCVSSCGMKLAACESD